MRLWKADLLGLVAGFLLGGGAVAWFWSEIEALYQGNTPPGQIVMPVPSPGPVAAMAWKPFGKPFGTPFGTEQKPVLPPPLPNVIRPGSGAGGRSTVAQTPLPAVIHPPPVASGKPAGPGSAMSGTGFFVSTDGTLLTAAHVVVDCARVQVSSPFVPVTAAMVLARDSGNDIALLRAPLARVPAVLPLGQPNAASRDLFVIGYPVRSGAPAREESWGTLENHRLSMLASAMADPRETIWFHDDAVSQGYSGGAVLDVVSGNAIGLVRATVKGGYLRVIGGLPSSGVAIGPGIVKLATFLAREAPNLALSPSTGSGARAVDIARRATLNVVCSP